MAQPRTSGERHRALITGVAGQDGSFLSELLLEHGYAVYGIVRPGADPADERLQALGGAVELLEADLLDPSALVAALERCRPHEVYNLASASFVPASWTQPILTAQLAAVGVTSMLEAIREVDTSIRFYQASSSEIFGEPLERPQTETTPLSPLTPYGVAKAYGHFIVRSYRSRYGLHASSGILYNHESWRRSFDFVPRKISRAAAAIALGLEEEVVLGNLGARRDWGFAGDYVRAMWLMLQQDDPSDYVIASGVQHSVEELVAWAFAHVGLDWREHVRVDEALLRGRAELHDLVGDSSKARSVLGWEPSVTLEELIALMVDEDRRQLDGRAAAGEASVVP